MPWARPGGGLHKNGSDRVMDERDASGVVMLLLLCLLCEFLFHTYKDEPLNSLAAA